jgi:hypothetical protein
MNIVQFYTCKSWQTSKTEPMAIPKKYPTPPPDFPPPEKHPETPKPVDPEDPLVPEEEDPDYIPDEEPGTLPPDELPPPGEGP